MQILYTWFARMRSFGKSLITKFKSLSRVGKIATVALLSVILPVLGFAFLIFLVWIGVFGQLPDRQELRHINNRTATEVYSADSVLLGRYFIQERSNISFKQIPAVVVDALVSTEDVRFYKHNGIDYKSLARVLVKSILLGQESGGGSTITQQLSKNLFPRESYGFLSLPVNKIKEAITARRIEKIYEKDQILELYLNTVPFGDGAFGIEAASRRYFSIPAQQLTTSEAAILIGMLKATYTYNPRLYPDRSRQRRDIVLSQMKKYGAIDQAQLDSVRKLPVKVRYSRITQHSGLAPYFRDIVKRTVSDWCSTHKKENGKPYNLYTDGLKVYTTVDSRLQQFAEEAMEKQMKNLQERFNKHWGGKDPWGTDDEIVTRAVHRSDRYKAMKAQGLSDDSIEIELHRPVPTTIFTWNGEKEVTISPYDSVRHHLKFLHTGILAMDPHTGAVKTWVGGINHQYFQYDHVKESTKRQVGSTFKPIVYASALEQGMRPCEYTSAAHVTYANLEGWAPENSSEENYERKYSMAGALAYSVNTVSVGVLERAGIPNVISLAENMGISSPLPRVPALALGVASVSVTEMVTAYSVFANGGKRVDPFIITSITDHEGNVLERYQHDDPPEQVLSAETAGMMVQMLGRVVDEGTASSLRTRYQLGNDVGGKTGTTQSNADGWFMAVTPELVIGSWVGADDPQVRFRSTALGQGAATALPIVAGYLQRINNSHDFQTIASARFPDLPARSRRLLDCDPWKKDQTWFERLIGKEKGPVTRDFGEKPKKKKRNFLQKLFGKD